MLVTYKAIMYSVYVLLILIIYIHANELAHSKCSENYHESEAVIRATIKANELLIQHPSVVEIKDRLLVMILFTRMRNRMELLKCSLLKLKANMMTNTTIDIFVWTLNRSNISNPAIIPKWFNTNDYPRVNWISIEPETWQIPCGLSHNSKWTLRQHFDVDYYLMGRWRLTFSLDFAKEMGYKYHLQFDDDAMLNNKIQYNIVHKFKENDYLMGVFSDLIGEIPQATLGLAELTRYWLTIKQYSPKGTLMKHLKPRNINGFSSDGWDRMYHPGYFIIFHIDFWYQNEVQDYLLTILKSGRDIEGRWQEQAVMNMIRLVFIPYKQLWVMNDIDIGHDRHTKSNFDNWCIKSGILTSSI